MNTVVYKVDPDNPGLDLAIIKKASNLLKIGGVVAFPTETVYGLGADALNPNAVKQIYAIKGRPSDNPLIIHIKDINDLTIIAKEISKEVKTLADAFWPGPLTMILQKTEIVPYETTANLETVAVRFPDNKIARLLMEESGVFIAAPSANLSGKPSPTKAQHVANDLTGKLQIVIDGGETNYGLESTIIDMTVSPPILLRPGAITKEMIEEVIGNINADKFTETSEEQLVKPKAPGMKYTHYSPMADICVVTGSKISEKIKELILNNNGKNLGVMATEETKHLYSGLDVKVFCVGEKNYPDTIAKNLFNTFRDFDIYKMDYVYAEGFPEEGILLAVMNRLKKAAGYNIINT